MLLHVQQAVTVHLKINSVLTRTDVLFSGPPQRTQLKIHYLLADVGQRARSVHLRGEGPLPGDRPLQSLSQWRAFINELTTTWINAIHGVEDNVP